MVIAIYGRKFSQEYSESIQRMIENLEKAAELFCIHEQIFDFLSSNIKFNKPVEKFSSHESLNKNTFCLISIGGDGTLLDTLTLIRDSGIPVLGINAGRLGFLSAITADEIAFATNCIVTGNYSIDSRTLVQLKSPGHFFNDFAYALNELAIVKSDTTSMITIKAMVNNQYLNTYWADGLIVATPTGSTGYSLSCGGPIISPESSNLVVTPIASHNLTVRPVIIPDNAEVKLVVEGRNQEYNLVMDSRSVIVNNKMEIKISIAGFRFNLLCPGQKNFYETIRNKLTWGLDKRN